MLGGLGDDVALGVVPGTSGTTARARSARPDWVTTTSASFGISGTEECSTVTPCLASCFLSVLASMTLDPMPASQATMSFLTFDPSMVAMSVVSFVGVDQASA